MIGSPHRVARLAAASFVLVLAFVGAAQASGGASPPTFLDSVGDAWHESSDIRGGVKSLTKDEWLYRIWQAAPAGDAASGLARAPVLSTAIHGAQRLQGVLKYMPLVSIALDATNGYRSGGLEGLATAATHSAANELCKAGVGALTNAALGAAAGVVAAPTGGIGSVAIVATMGFASGFVASQVCSRFVMPLFERFMEDFVPRAAEVVSAAVVNLFQRPQVAPAQASSGGATASAPPSVNRLSPPGSGATPSAPGSPPPSPAQPQAPAPCAHVGEPGGWDYCSASCPCAAGQGDCDRDSDCEPGLTCVRARGAAYGYRDIIDVCETTR